MSASNSRFWGPLGALRSIALALCTTLAAGCIGMDSSPVAKTAEGKLTPATRTSAANVWIVWDEGARREPLEGEFDCLINHTDFNNIVATYQNSPYRANQLLWDPAHGHSGSTTVSRGACGALFSPNPQCLVNAVLNDPKIGVPQDGDLFIYVVPGQCGGGNNNGGSNGLPLTGTAVRGAGGQTIHVTSATVGDGSGDNLVLCQERVAVHEAFESITDVSAADCCTGQTPGNLCPDCSPACAQYWGSSSGGPLGFGSNTITCNGVSYASQKVEPWINQSDEWQPQFCRGAVAKSSNPPTCGCYAGTGKYCGANVLEYASQHGCTVPNASGSNLYFCSGGNWSLSETCANGCSYNPNGADSCTTPPTCGCYAGTGEYCGANALDYASQHGCTVPNANRSDLYFCSGGNWSLSETCANGCSYNPNGADACTPPPSCTGTVCGGSCCPAGDWCGATGKCCSACGGGCPC